MGGAGTTPAETAGHDEVRGGGAGGIFRAIVLIFGTLRPSKLVLEPRQQTLTQIRLKIGKPLPKTLGSVLDSGMWFGSPLSRLLVDGWGAKVFSRGSWYLAAGVRRVRVSLLWKGLPGARRMSASSGSAIWRASSVDANWQPTKLGSASPPSGPSLSAGGSSAELTGDEGASCLADGSDNAPWVVVVYFGLVSDFWLISILFCKKEKRPCVWCWQGKAGFRKYNLVGRCFDMWEPGEHAFPLTLLVILLIWWGKCFYLLSKIFISCFQVSWWNAPEMLMGLWLWPRHISQQQGQRRKQKSTLIDWQSAVEHERYNFFWTWRLAFNKDQPQQLQ